ncbi:hypothetical protein COEREDRAFT_98575 [Coemansia reversa NRRL 1564]|uniref:Uncharacterized protein n=1 Tax=Coemansia reversa (strain ATCC 12441 / NRRL 1564) TaxID=763665 RepID=A0A2G5B6Z2_COERN|nr:hypothetical protein COEREDRAFT_98575 [Coemansia reversa NRRL 1564]|eukprot:PIA14813.1 hypothetical protein COEREDRAFT_98575 [Coemansia reversa NRRL 1564]
MTLLEPLRVLVALAAMLATAFAQTTASSGDSQEDDNSEDADEFKIDISQMDLLSGIPTVAATIVGIIQLVPPPVKRKSVHLQDLLEWLTDRIENDFMVTLSSCASKCHTQTYEPNTESLTKRIRSNIGILGIHKCTGNEVLTAEDLVAIIQDGSGHTLLHLARLAGYPHMNKLINAVNIIQYSPTHGRSVITWQLLGICVMYYIPRLFGVLAEFFLHLWHFTYDCLRRIRNCPPIDRSYTARLAFDYRMADLARHRMIFQHTPWVRFGLYYILMELRQKHMGFRRWSDGDQRGDDMQNKSVDTYRMEYMLKVALFIATDECSATRLLHSIALHSIRVMSLFRYVGSVPPYMVTSSFSTVKCRLNSTTLVMSHEKVNSLYWHMYPPENIDHVYGGADSHHAHSVYDLMIKIFCSPMGNMVLDTMDTRVLLNLAFMDLPIAKIKLAASLSDNQITTSIDGAASSSELDKNTGISTAINSELVQNSTNTVASTPEPVEATRSTASSNQALADKDIDIDGIPVKPHIQLELCRAQITQLEELHDLLEDFNSPELFWGPQPWLLIVLQKVIARLTTEYPDNTTTEVIKNRIIRPRIICTTIRLLCFAPFQPRFELDADGKPYTPTFTDMWELSHKIGNWEIFENGYGISMPSWCLCNNHCRGICTLIVNELKMYISVQNYFTMPYAFSATLFPFSTTENLMDVVQQSQPFPQSHHILEQLFEESSLSSPVGLLQPIRNPDAVSNVSSESDNYTISSEESETSQLEQITDIYSSAEHAPVEHNLLLPSIENNRPLANEGNRGLSNNTQNSLSNTESKNISISKLSMNFKVTDASNENIINNTPTDNTSNPVRLVCVPSLKAIDADNVNLVTSKKPSNRLQNPRFDTGNYQLAELIYTNEPLVAVVYGDALGRTKPCNITNMENGSFIEEYPYTIDKQVKNDQQSLTFIKTLPLKVSKSDSHKLAISTKIREPRGFLQYQHSSRKNDKLKLHRPFRSVYTKKDY